MTEQANRNFTSVKSRLDGAPQGALHIIRPSKLAEEGVTGVVAEGFYEGATPNKFDETKFDYKVRAANGDLTILNSTGSLAKQMSLVNIGEYVQITYNGKQTLTSGKLKGKAVHNFDVAIDSGAEA